MDTGLLWSLVKVGGLSRFLLSFSGDCEVTLSANIDARPLNLISSLLWSADDGVDGDREESDVSLKSMVASLLRAIGRTAALQIASSQKFTKFLTRNYINNDG